jgi:hypothetical protein
VDFGEAAVYDGIGTARDQRRNASRSAPPSFGRGRAASKVRKIMMRTTRMLIGVAGIAGVVMLVLFLTAPTPGVTLSNFRQLHTQMSWDEIEAVMRPPDKRGQMYTWSDGDKSVYIVTFFSGKLGTFRTDDELVSILGLTPPESLFTRIRSLLGI